MCIELRTLASCGCQTTQMNICLEFINHTHKQLDNKPCPKFKLQSAIKNPCQAPCKQRSRVKYKFEQAGESLSQAMNRAHKQWEEERRARKAAFIAESQVKVEKEGSKRVKKEEEDIEIEM